jgi:hypothetical protein
MSKKKTMMNLQKLTDIMKPMTRLQLNKFVSNLNKELKITNASKMKREDLEAELLTRADIIIDMIDKDKELKLFDTTTKPREYKITKEQELELSKQIDELSKKAMEEEDMGQKTKLIKEAKKKANKLAKSTVGEASSKTSSKKEQPKMNSEPKETFENLSKKFDELNKNILKETNIGTKQKMMKESSEIMAKMQKMA